MNGYIFVNCQQCGEDLTQSVLVDTLKSNSDRTFLKIPPHVCKAPAPAPAREAVELYSGVCVCGSEVFRLTTRGLFCENCGREKEKPPVEKPCKRCGKLPSDHIGFWYCYEKSSVGYIQDRTK